MTTVESSDNELQAFCLLSLARVKFQLHVQVVLNALSTSTVLVLIACTYA